MTLLVTVVSHRGLWQASDHRLTFMDGATEDASMKHVRIQAEDGKALIAYAGLGSVGDVHISEWIRRVLRGARRPIEGHLRVLGKAADHSIAPYSLRANTPHTFSVAAFKDATPVFYAITNRMPAGSRMLVSKWFDFRGMALGSDLSQVGVNIEGTGIAAFRNTEQLLALIRGIIRRRRDHSSLGSNMSGVLAQLIRQASEAPESRNTVSPTSVVSYLRSPADVYTSRVYGWNPATPVLMQDIAGETDMTGIIEAILPTIEPMLQRSWELSKTGKPGASAFDRDALNEALRKRDWRPNDKL